MAIKQSNGVCNYITNINRSKIELALIKKLPSNQTETETWYPQHQTVMPQAHPRPQALITCLSSAYIHLNSLSNSTLSLHELWEPGSCSNCRHTRNIARLLIAIKVCQIKQTEESLPALLLGFHRTWMAVSTWYLLLVTRYLLVWYSCFGYLLYFMPISAFCQIAFL